LRAVSGMPQSRHAACLKVPRRWVRGRGSELRRYSRHEDRP
jgi:hypothetical protein